MRVAGLEPGAAYRAFYFDPREGREHAIGPVAPGPDGTWTIPLQPTLEDWVLVMERA